jgi:7-cyano-7-deazaguanine synthase
VTEGASPKAVLCLSGGLDSATVLAMARADGFAVHALAFAYGQRHDVELEAARRVADAGGAVELKVVTLDLRAFGGSALTDDIEVPKGRDAESIDAAVDDAEVPVTYVPARNTIFLSFALAYAEVIGARDLFLGANQVDFSGYPDCRPAFVQAFEELANVATAHAEGGRVRVHAPLMDMDKAAIIRRGNELGVDYAITHSCYDPVMGADGASACGACDACVLRRKGFQEAGVPDPTRYANT